jgi:hypothetical protein
MLAAQRNRGLANSVALSEPQPLKKSGREPLLFVHANRITNHERNGRVIAGFDRNECVNDGTPESVGERRNADLLQTYLEGAGLEAGGSLGAKWMIENHWDAVACDLFNSYGKSSVRIEPKVG